MLKKIEMALRKHGFCVVQVDDSPQGTKLRDVFNNQKSIGHIDNYQILKINSNYVFYIMCEDFTKNIS